MRELMVLIRYRLIGWWHGEKNPAKRALNRLGIFGFLVFALGNLAASAVLFNLLFAMVSLDIRAALLEFCAQSLALTALLMATGVATNAALSSLYESPILCQVFAWPISPRVLYASGFLDIALSGTGAVAAVCVPAWVGLGFAVKASWGFFAVGLAGLIFLSLLASAAVCLILSFLLHLVNAARLRQILLSLVLVALVGLVVLIQIMGMRVLSQGWGNTLTGLNQAINFWRWLPNGLVARSALSALAGQVAASLSALGSQLLICAGGILVAVWYGGRTYLICWTKAQEVRGGLRFSALYRNPGRGRPIAAVVGKDWTLMARDPIFWTNFIFFLLCLFFYTWSLKQNSSLMNNARSSLEHLHFFLVSFLSTSWLALAGAMAVSREGSAWWLTQTAPLDVKQILVAKLCFGASGMLLFFLLAELVFTAAGIFLPNLAETSLIIFGLTGIMAGAGITADLILPDFTLHLGIVTGGAHSGGKLKIVFAMLASFGGTGLAAATFYLGRFLIGTLGACIAVGLEGLVILGAAFLMGQPMLRKVMVQED